jgi:hypothetical protein
LTQLRSLWIKKCVNIKFIYKISNCNLCLEFSITFPHSLIIRTCTQYIKVHTSLWATLCVCVVSCYDYIYFYRDYLLLIDPISKFKVWIIFISWNKLNAHSTFFYYFNWILKYEQPRFVAIMHASCTFIYGHVRYIS